MAKEESSVKPALAAKEWANPEHRVDRDGWWLYEPFSDCPVIGSGGSGVSIADDMRHAVAALALYNQPFGFTRENAALLREVASREGDFSPTEARDLELLADRIEALLPPEKS